MPKDDMTEDKKWLPDEGWYNLEIVTMEEGVSKKGNEKYVINFANASNPSQGIRQDFTNIPGKRWLLRQMLEACDIKPKQNKEGREIFDWEIADIEGKTVSAHIYHDKTPFIDRNNQERIIPKARIDQFKKISIRPSNEQWPPESEESMENEER